MTAPTTSIQQSLASTLLDYAKEWSTLDPNPVTLQYVQKLISHIERGEAADAAFQELKSLFPLSSGSNNDANSNKCNEYPPPQKHPRIGFGTAGLRGRMQPGPIGMNDLVVIQTAQGIARYVLKKRNSNSQSTDSVKAVIAYDHRSNATLQLSSRCFAMYTHLVFTHAGIQTTLLDGYVPTPILSFAVKHLNASVGIMVTASHNPKLDNGYKVYTMGGVQIRSPVDEEISKEIGETWVPWVDYGCKLQKLKADVDPLGKACGECYGLSDVEETKRIVDAYYEAVRCSGLVSVISNATATTATILKTPKFAYTAMHGIGHPYALQSFLTFGLSPLSFCAVPSQRDPDPNFGTVPFPNPEEKGALDEAIEFANKEGCNVVLANDPDADRLGVAEVVSYGEGDGKWRVFTGDEIGSLLGYWLWQTIGMDSDQVSLLILQK